MSKILTILQGAVGAILLLAGISKIADFEGFNLYIKLHRFLGETASFGVANLLITAEIWLGWELLQQTKSAAIRRGVALLFAGFLLYHGVKILWGPSLGFPSSGCKCFGTIADDQTHVLWRGLLTSFFALAWFGLAEWRERPDAPSEAQPG